MQVRAQVQTSLPVTESPVPCGDGEGDGVGGQVSWKEKRVNEGPGRSHSNRGNGKPKGLKPTESELDLE